MFGSFQNSITWFGGKSSELEIGVYMLHHMLSSHKIIHDRVYDIIFVYLNNHLYIMIESMIHY
jgi:hypothetical protein